MPERFLERLVLNWNLHSSLERWKKDPDGKENMARMQKSLKDATGRSSLSLMIKKEVLSHGNVCEGFATGGVVRGYGSEAGDLIIFDTAKIRTRVGQIAGRGYLFLERDGFRVGFLRPEYIAGIKVKEYSDFTI